MEAKPKMANPYKCPQGGAHGPVYRGKETQEYYCSKCGEYISKAELKEKTDK